MQQHDHHHHHHHHHHHADDEFSVFLRRANDFVKYFVSLTVFVVCVAKNWPGTNVLPAFYLLSSLFLAAFVKLLKKALKQPRPNGGAVSKNKQKKTPPTSPNSIVADDSAALRHDDGSGLNDFEKDVDDDDDDLEDDDDDDHGMPSSHSTMCAFFSWVAVWSMLLYDAFGLYSRAMAGMLEMLLPIVQLFSDSSKLLAMLGNDRMSKLDLLAGGSDTRNGDAMTFVLVILVSCAAILILGATGAQLRVWNGDHTVPQVLAGYLLGFVWAMGSLVCEMKFFRVNVASLFAHYVLTGAAVVLGVVAAYLILIKKKKKKRPNHHSFRTKHPGHIQQQYQRQQERANKMHAH